MQSVNSRIAPHPAGVLRRRVALSAVLLLATLLRAWGLHFGLPNLYHPDEPRYVASAQILFKTADLNPYSLPRLSSSALVYVVNGLAYGPYYAIGKLIAAFDAPQDIAAPVVPASGAGRTAMPGTFLLGRSVTLLFGVASVFLAWLIGRRLTDRPAVGWLAALLLAVSPTAVAHSRYITPDTFLLFFVLLAFWAAVEIGRGGRLRHYLLAGVALGCVVSTKINGILIALPVLVAHFYRRRLKGLRDPRLYGMAAAAAIAFVLTTPYLLGDFRKVIGDLLFEGRHYSAGHPGMEGDSFAWYVAYLWQTEGPLVLLAVAALLRGLYRRSKMVIFLAVFPLVYLAFISSFEVRNARTLLPLLPFLFLLAAWLLVDVAQVANLRHRPILRPLIGLATIVALIALPLTRTVRETLDLLRPDGRETARVWIAENLPAGAQVALESYAAFVDPQRFSVLGSYKMIDRTPDWYVANGFEYLVFSQGMFGRFYADPARYAAEIAAYEAFFQRFRRVKSFDDGGYEIRVYKIERP